MIHLVAKLCKKTIVLTIAALLSTIAVSAAQHSAIHTSQPTDESPQISILQSGSQYSRTYVVNGKRFSWNDLTAEQKATIGKLEKDVERVEQHLAVIERRWQQIERILDEKAEKLDRVTEELEAIEKLRVTERKSAVKLEKAALKMEKQALNIAKMMQEKEAEMRELEEKLRQLDMIDMSQLDEASDRLDAWLVEIAETMD